MTIALAIALFWLLTGVTCFAACWYQSRRPISEAERVCARVDQALRRQYGV